MHLVLTHLLISPQWLCQAFWKRSTISKRNHQNLQKMTKQNKQQKRTHLSSFFMLLRFVWTAENIGYFAFNQRCDLIHCRFDIFSQIKIFWRIFQALANFSCVGKSKVAVHVDFCYVVLSASKFEEVFWNSFCTCYLSAICVDFFNNIFWISFLF